MIIIPVEENTLPLIAALNNGVKPKIDPLEHSSFIYHDAEHPPELVPTVIAASILNSKGFVAVETRYAYTEE